MIYYTRIDNSNITVSIGGPIASTLSVVLDRFLPSLYIDSLSIGGPTATHSTYYFYSLSVSKTGAQNSVFDMSYYTLWTVYYLT